MKRTKNVLGVILAFVMVVLPMIGVGAAPAQTDTIDGTIQSCVAATDPFTGDPIVVCEINLAEEGGTQTVRLSVDDAVFLELAILEEDGTVTIIATEGQEVSIDLSMVLVDPCVLPDDASQPISKILTNFFCKDLGMDYDAFQSLHEDGFGFGVIAQACFMATKLEGTGDLCMEILHAKENRDYSNLPLPNDVTVTNWGQLRKAVFSDDSKDKTNLGSIVSEEKSKGHGNGNDASEHGKAKK